jgi:hypothetical protein
MRQSCEDINCARDAKCGIKFTVANKYVSLISNLMRQSCKDFCCAKDARCRIKFIVAIKVPSPFYMYILVRQSCEDLCYAEVSDRVHGSN